MSTPPARASLALAVASLAAATLVALACSHPGTEASRPEQGRPTGTASGGAAEAFVLVKSVLQSPRCVNCHPAGDAPHQGDDGHVHRQHVLRGPGGFGVSGLACDACHGDVNPPASYGPHAPPGVSEWRLPPPDTKMVFEGLDASALCEQLKDPARNGGKNLDALVRHVSSDPLVLWGWSPGRGRTPPPVAHADFVAAFKSWADAGAPCPR